MPKSKNPASSTKASKPASKRRAPSRGAKNPDSLRITRVYTRVGDGGKTRLASGREVAKSNPRLEAFGTIDELQAALGVARDELAAALKVVRGPRLTLIGEHLAYLQNLLFTLGGDLATPVEDRWPEMPLIGPDDVGYLENLIDALNAGLPPLKDFVLPGGHPAATALHVCRVICRRGERAVEHLAQSEPVGGLIRPFVNRLSDTLFVLARGVDASLRDAGLAPAETIWKRGTKPPSMP